jgi:serine/threonine protein kinase
MAGSFGYAAPEVMLKQGHGKPVDMWSLGIITYTLLCGYPPFRSDSLQDLIDECTACRVVFHERYWKDVSQDAKEFILKLLRPNPDDRWTSEVRIPLSKPTPFTFPAKSLLLRHLANPRDPSARACPPLAQRPDRLGPQPAARDPRLPGARPPAPRH